MTDVLVIGGGPGGSTAAITLAGMGYDVTLLEKARHPRFHIGESLLPANLPLFERLGVAAQIKGIGMQKWGAEFVSPWHAVRSQTFEFAEGWNKSLPFAYQVRRSEFDEILIRRAADRGARVIEGCRVTEVDFQPAGGARVAAEHDDGRKETFEARFIIDASGRDTFLGNRLKIKQRNRKHNSSAMYAHFKGAQRHADCKRAGNISLFWFDHGWMWLIPLADGATSVGTVVWPYYMKSRKQPLREFFLDTLAQCAPMTERLRGAELISEVEATGNYSYSCDRPSGENYLLVGDAYAFVDPMFSSGVMMAMTTAITAAETVATCLKEPGRAAAARRHFDRVSKHGPKEFSWFIHRVTNPTMRDLFMGPRNILRMKEALLGLLAGDIYGSTPIWPSLRAFKAVYYIGSFVNLKRSLAATRRRRLNIQPVEPDRMTAG
ncbi:MAG TPA: NAD(P)/FAD-dependent oxidoreductase [Steroidobacteraceae bacterium]